MLVLGALITAASAQPLQLPAGPGPDAFGIVNGTQAGPGDFPAVVSLVQEYYGGAFSHSFCSGTLIHPRWVLTAAHCLVDDFGNGTAPDAILVGTSIDPFDVVERLEPVAYTWQGLYNPNPYSIEHDVGLIELASPATTPPMGVHTDAISNALVGTDLTFVGYGITDDFAQNSGTKRYTDIPVDDTDPYTLISYAPNTNVCQGDSGGAALIWTPDGPELIGVNSWVAPGCVGGATGSARVDIEIDWILNYVPEIYTAKELAEEPEPPTDTTPDPGTDPPDDTEPNDEEDPEESEEAFAGVGPTLDPAVRPTRFRRGCRCSQAEPFGLHWAGGLLLLLVGWRR